MLEVDGGGEQRFLVEIPLVGQVQLVGLVGLQRRIAPAPRSRLIDHDGVQREAGHKGVQRRPGNGHGRAQAQHLVVGQVEVQVQAGQPVGIAVGDGHRREGRPAVAGAEPGTARGDVGDAHPETAGHRDVALRGEVQFGVAFLGALAGVGPAPDEFGGRQHGGVGIDHREQLVPIAPDHRRGVEALDVERGQSGARQVDGVGAGVADAGGHRSGAQVEAVCAVGLLAIRRPEARIERRDERAVELAGHIQRAGGDVVAGARRHAGCVPQVRQLVRHGVRCGLPGVGSREDLQRIPLQPVRRIDDPGHLRRQRPHHRPVGRRTDRVQRQGLRRPAGGVGGLEQAVPPRLSQHVGVAVVRAGGQPHRHPRNHPGRLRQDRFRDGRRNSHGGQPRRPRRPREHPQRRLQHRQWRRDLHAGEHREQLH